MQALSRQFSKGDGELTDGNEVRKEIFAAVAKAMGEVKRVGKDNRNAEQKYDFASIDDFMAMVGPICAANGLVTIIDEDARAFIEKPGKYGPTQWVSITYQITTYHASGEHLPTVQRHVEVIRNGPQAYGAAQSYVLKQYYRGLLAIPTGDKDDPDHGTVPEEPGARQPENPQTPKPQRQPDTGAIEAAIGYLSEADTLNELATRWGNIPKDMQRVPDVISAKNRLKGELQPAPKSPDLGDELNDEIPHQ